MSAAMVRTVAALAAAALFPGGHALNLQVERPTSILQEAGPEPEKHLRLCSAYMHSGALDVRLERTGRSLVSLSYKECRDLALPLQDGDELHFTLRDASAPALEVGSFAMSGLPTAPGSSLLLVAQRRAGASLRAAFQSHAYAEGAGESAQLAVIDASEGAEAGAASERTVRIEEARPKESGAGRSQAAASRLRKEPQQVRLSSVVDVAPGQYQVSLAGGAAAGGGYEPSASLSAQPRVSYVALRVGGKAASPKVAADFPEDVVVFPQPKAPERSTLGSMLESARAWVLGI